MFTLPETKQFASENGWFEDDPASFCRCFCCEFQGGLQHPADRHHPGIAALRGRQDLVSKVTTERLVPRRWPWMWGWPWMGYVMLRFCGFFRGGDVWYVCQMFLLDHVKH